MKSQGFANRLLSRRCCGGPVLALALICGAIGALFILLSATSPGIMFILTGAAGFGLCLAMGYRRCRLIPDHS